LGKNIACKAQVLFIFVVTGFNVTMIK